MKSFFLGQVILVSTGERSLGCYSSAVSYFQMFLLFCPPNTDKYIFYLQPSNHKMKSQRFCMCVLYLNPESCSFYSEPLQLFSRHYLTCQNATRLQAGKYRDPAAAPGASPPSLSFSGQSYQQGITWCVARCLAKA